MKLRGHDSEGERLCNCALNSSAVMTARLHLTRRGFWNLLFLAQLVEHHFVRVDVLGSNPGKQARRDRPLFAQKMVGRIAQRVKRERVKREDQKDADASENRRTSGIKDQSRNPQTPTSWVMAPLFIGEN